MRDIVIYGAGGFAREVAVLLQDMIADGAALQLHGFLSDDASTHGSEVAGLPVLGDDKFLKKHAGSFHVAVAVGAPAAKRCIALKTAAVSRGFPELVHPTVVRSRRVQVGQGVIICAMSALTVDITIGDFGIINLGCTVGHDSVLSDYVTLAPSVSISGNVIVESGCDIGTGARVIQGKTIGSWSIVGAGAVVNADLPANCTAIGVPARAIKQRDAGWHLVVAQ